MNRVEGTELLFGDNRFGDEKRQLEDEDQNDIHKHTLDNFTHSTSADLQVKKPRWRSRIPSNDTDEQKSISECRRWYRDGEEPDRDMDLDFAGRRRNEHC